MSLVLSIDGAPATAEDLATAALVNYGAYTSLLVEGGGVRGLDLHLARLEAAAIDLFGEPVGKARLRELMRAALGDHQAAWLRVSLFSPHLGPRTPDWTGQPGVMIAASPPISPLAESVRVHVQTHVRDAAHLKHSATFPLIRARRTAVAAGFDDALFTDADGLISEGTLWNVGFIRGETVVWPQAPMLAGVTQTLITRGLAAVGLDAVSAPVRLADLGGFDGAFLCNSATPACAITAIGTVGFAGADAMIKRLNQAWRSNPRQTI